MNSDASASGHSTAHAEGLSADEQHYLLVAARTALEHAVRDMPLPAPDTSTVSPRLLEIGASFVTLTIGGNLRGCIGTLEARQPLIDDVREHAASAALQDYRFPPVTPRELAGIRIEVSRLTSPQPLAYASPEDLLAKLRPGIDGVVLRDGPRRATFLPQVWQKIPDPADFLANLCYKMGAADDRWRHVHLEVLTYQVEEFHE